MIREHLPSSLDYLLGQTDCRGRHRPAYIVDGCYDTFATELKRMKQKQNQYITICFRDSKPLAKLGGNEFLSAFKEDVVNLLLPGLDHSQFHYMCIVHDNSKHDFELNFVLLQTVNNKRFYGYWHERDRKCFEAFDKFIHVKYPQLTDPRSPELMRALANENKPWEDNQQSLFEKINQQVKSHNPAITDKEQLVNFMFASGYKVTRIRRSTITVSDGNTSVKLTGPLCTEGKAKAEDLADQYEALLAKRQKRLTTTYSHLKQFIKQESKSHEIPERRINTQDTRTAELPSGNGNKPNVGQNPETRRSSNEGRSTDDRISKSIVQNNGETRRVDQIAATIARAERAIVSASTKARDCDQVISRHRGEDLCHTEGCYGCQNDSTNYLSQNKEEYTTTIPLVESLDVICDVLDSILRPKYHDRSIIAEIMELLDALFAPPVQKPEDKPMPTPPPPPAKQEEVQVCKVKLEVAPTEFQTKVKLYQSEIMQCEWGKAIHGQEQINELMLTIVNAIKQNVVLGDIKQCQTFEAFKNLVYPNQQRSKSPWFDL